MSSHFNKMPPVLQHLNCRALITTTYTHHTSLSCLFANRRKENSLLLEILPTRQHRTIVPPQRPSSSKRTLTLSAKAIVDASPLPLQPYLRLIRLDRPIGTWLLFLPSAWSLCLATPVGELPDARLIALFGLGSFMMRSAGCTVNDMWDKDFDAEVARTRGRPIACGEISRLNALLFLSLPLSASLAILLTLNSNTILLGFGAVLPCVVYPLMKRVTYWPQAFLGLTFNYGVLMGWCAVRGALEWPVLPLYISCIAWTLVYDTIYGFQDRKDDQRIGVKSTALRFGVNTRLWLSGFTSIVTSGLVTTGIMCDQAWPYYAGVGLFTAHLAHQIYTVDLSCPEDCGQKFRSNRNIGLAFWALIIAGGLYHRSRLDSTRNPPAVVASSQLPSGI